MDPIEDLILHSFSDEDSTDDMELEHSNDELYVANSDIGGIDMTKGSGSPSVELRFSPTDNEDQHTYTGICPNMPWDDKPKVVERWLQMYQDGTFTTQCLREFWKMVVPPNFCPVPGHNCMESLYDETQVVREMILPLEQFLCGAPTGDPDKVWEELSKNDNPPALCGRVFRMGEPTYSCRDCGADPTCVLCADCFRNSEHKQHRYKLSTSVGGGYCDCGDTEAWRQAPRCSLHQCDATASALLLDPTARKKAALDRLDRIAAVNMADRCRFVIEAVLKYAQELLGSNTNLNLPVDLKIKEGDSGSMPVDRRDFGPCGPELYTSVYATAVYNDESHTFEQVIQALQRSLDVSSREAVDLATCIDREGRSIVRCSSFQACNQARSAIERHTSRLPPRALKVCVLLGPFLAHQGHALRLLNWLRKLMGICEGFRLLLADIIMKPISRDSDVSLLESVLLSDTQLWKAARSAWHRLFIAGLLMDPDAKRDFATIFTRHYGRLMSDFISDDHDHSHSVTSLSVQLFTVPTLAQYLMGHHEALTALLRCFLGEIERRKNLDGLLSFDRSRNQQSFRRAMYVLYDIKYLLSAVPLPELDEGSQMQTQVADDTDSTSGRWSEPLRKGFLHGLHMLLSLLASMEGMDSVVRQTGQHVEFEAEWEAAFNLHCKLAPVLTLIVQWCASDRKVLLKSTRAALKKFQELQPMEQQPKNAVTLLTFTQLCYDYDVSTQPISVHLPLSRMISGLLLALPKHGLDWNCSEMTLDSKPTLLQLMEAPLRLQVLMAQVQAGMWRHNGYSLINQLYFYQNVRCRTEMYDRDIVLLQLCAALFDSPDSFLLACLHRFNLLNWAKADFDANQQQLAKQTSSSTKKSNTEEDMLRQTIFIAEEFLRLIIILSLERFTPGIGQVDEDECLSHEVLHLLCVESQGHAALNRALPEDAHHETGLERVADKVAVFRKPLQGTGRGVFSLKPEFYGDYNVYHYHYSREDQSRSEDNVRKIRRGRNEENCCPPPVPITLAPALRGLVGLMNCDITMHLIHQVLLRTYDLRSRTFSEGQLQAALHLTGLALREEESCQQDKTRPAFAFSVEAQERFGLLTVLESLQTNGRVDVHRPLLMWTIRKFRAVHSAAQSSSSAEGAGGAAMEAESAEGPGQESPAEAAARQRKAEMAAARRAAILAQMSAQQKSFIKEHAKLFQETGSSISESGGASTSNLGSTLSGSAMDLSESSPTSAQTFPICLGPGFTVAPSTSDTSYTCIVCQEEHRQTGEQPVMVLASFVQLSAVLRWKNDKDAVEEPLPETWPMLIDGGRRIGTHISTCGHVMHFQCWQQHFDSLLGRERRRSYRPRQSASFDVERHEFLCPLCKSLSNAVLPILPNRSASSVRPSGSEAGQADMSIWLEGLQLLADNSREMKYSKTDNTSIYETCGPAELETKLGSMKSKLFVNVLMARTRPKIATTLKEMASLFVQSVYTTAVAANPNADDIRVPMAIAQATAFTILSTESLLAYQNHSPSTGLAARQEEGLRALLRLVISMESIVTSQEVMKNYALHLLRMVLLPSSTISVLEIDAFGLLLGLFCTLPSLSEPSFDSDVRGVPQFNPILAWHVFRLCLFCHVTQIAATMAPASEHMDMDQPSCSASTFTTSESWQTYLQVLGRPDIASHANPTEQWVTEQCLPFLRSSAILFHFITNIPYPKLDDAYDNYAEAVLWLRYLGVESLSQLVSESWSKALLSLWNVVPPLASTSDVVLAETTLAKPRPPWTFPVMSSGLITLPSDYSELINAASLFTCPNSEGDEARTPAMCLVTGKMLCSQSYCCQTELDQQQVGACTAHAQVCGLGACLFLRVRECKLLLMAGKSKGCFLPPPYVDAYGETDQGLRRGDPLHICDASRRKLELLWRSHGLYNEAAKYMENSQALVVTEWHHL
ncbi:E3 ubiquitin-protein ligase UBR2-like isoform X1 [Daphnia carinata]|uniref:E3 ubiquitin-protein ligase UBR2-like isoform X1 n=1 Tax=Daphnia carinata TaxID=120202 RepID=UPI0025807460|nr:E3 ubiquitin-protein ligase UBR2-like isoform X1 [Daphnia carinata]